MQLVSALFKTNLIKQNYLYITIVIRWGGVCDAKERVRTRHALYTLLRTCGQMCVRACAFNSVSDFLGGLFSISVLILQFDFINVCCIPGVGYTI